MRPKGPNIGCLACVTKHAGNAIHARLYVFFFPISHAYLSCWWAWGRMVAEVLIFNEISVMKSLLALPFEILELHIVSVSNLNIPWEVELGKLWLRFQFCYLLLKRLKDNWILWLPSSWIVQSFFREWCVCGLAYYRSCAQFSCCSSLICYNFPLPSSTPSSVVQL